MTDTIIILEEKFDGEEIKNLLLKIKDCKVFTLNYFAYRNLQKLGISSEIGEKYLSETDKKEIDKRSINATINWYNQEPIKNFLTFSGINLGNLIELELLQYLTAVFRDVTTILKILENEKPNKVISSTYLNEFIEKVARSKNIEVTLLRVFQPPSLYHDNINIKFNIGKIPISFVISRKRYLAVKKITEKLIRGIFRLNPVLKSKKKSILLLDFNVVMYDTLVNELSKLNKDILLLNHRRPAVWNLKSSQIIRNSKCKVITLDNFEKKLQNKILSEIDLISSNIDKISNLDEIFENFFSIYTQTFWPSIKSAFVGICKSRFAESVRRIVLLDELFTTFDISVVLEWAESGQEEKELLQFVNKKSIPSVMLQHGLFSNSRLWNQYDRFTLGFSSQFLSTKQAIWDNLTEKQALSFGHKKENLIITGSPRHDNFFNSVNDSSAKGVIILATTSVPKVSAEMSSYESYLKFENFIKEVCLVVKAMPDKKLIIKPHPHYENLSNTTELIKEIDPSIQIIYDANLIDLISNCELLITFNNSTIALDSIILNKPTISLQFEKWAEEDNVAKLNAILSISNVNEVKDAIHKVLYDEKFRKNLLENAQIFLQNFANKGIASKCLAMELDRF